VLSTTLESDSESLSGREGTNEEEEDIFKEEGGRIGNAIGTWPHLVVSNLKMYSIFSYDLVYWTI